MITITVNGDDAHDILRELRKLLAHNERATIVLGAPTGSAAEADDRLIKQMHDAGFAKNVIAAAETGAAAAVDVGNITGTDDTAQIELPLGKDKPKRTRRTRAQIEADNAIALDAGYGMTQPEVVDNTGSAQPLQGTPAADGASPAAAGEVAPTTNDPAAAEITPEAFRAKLQEAFTTDDGLRHLGSLLQEFGYERVKNVEAKDYGAIMARADQLVADRVAA